MSLYILRGELGITDSSPPRLPEILTAAVQAPGTLASVGPLLLPPGCGFRGSSQLLCVLLLSSWPFWSLPGIGEQVAADSWDSASGCPGWLSPWWGGCESGTFWSLQPEAFTWFSSPFSLLETSRSRAPEMDGGVESPPVLNCVPRVRTELGFDQLSNQGVAWFYSLSLAMPFWKWL